MKKKKNPLAADWDGDKWRNRCAWCCRKMPEEAEVFGITIALHAEAFRVFDPGSIQPLYLPPAGRVVPMIVVAEDSPAKQEGKDAAFQLCSEDCARELQAALRQSLAQEQG